MERSLPLAAIARRWRNPALLILGALALVHALRGFAPAQTVDFYQFWGVPSSQQRSGGTLGPPYQNLSGYRASLESYFSQPDHATLQPLHRRRMGSFEPFGSPLLYLSFAPLPDRYVRASTIFFVFQLFCWTLGSALLGHVLGRGARVGTAIGFGCLLLYRPLYNDLLAGNLNAVQLAALSVLLALSGTRDKLRGVLFVGLTVALVMWKPNTGLVAVALLAHRVAALGLRDVVRCAAIAAPAIALLVAIPAVFFGSVGVWLEWARFVFVDNAGMMSEIPLGEGNTSPVRLAVERLGLAPGSVSLTLSAILIATLAWFGRGHGRSVILDAPAVVSIAIVATFAVSPLVWFHYFVLALVPILWLARDGPRRLETALAAVALLLYSAAWVPLTGFLGTGLEHGLLAGLWALTWTLLWAGILVSIAQLPSDEAESSTSTHSRP